MSNKLVGKTKQVFNTSLYYDSVRSVSNPDKLSEQLAVNVLDASYFTAVYSPIITENNQDKLRMAQILIYLMAPYKKIVPLHNCSTINRYN